MRSDNLKKLLFHVVRSEPLINEFISAQRTSHSHHKNKFSTYDHDAVNFSINLLKQLSDDSIDLKLNHIGKGVKINNGLSSTDLKKIARNAKWTKYETGFFASGFYISEQIRRDCTNLLYPNGNEPKFTIGYFPILEAVLEIEKLLIKSSLFSKSHRTYYYDTSDCISLIRWLKRMELPLPKGLQERVSQFHATEQPVRSVVTTQAKDLNAKERTSMLILIHAMAKLKFQYTEGESLGPPKTKIHQAILDAGLDMSERTIGEYLKKAQAEADTQKEKKQ